MTAIVPHRSPFRAAIIGEGTLPIRCGEILLREGHRIVGVVSPDDEVRRWARSHGLEARRPKEDLIGFLKREPFDYLFSIVNYTILPKDLLSLPARAAINYHDAPLPRYAGVYATSWALLNGERRHGVSWHEVGDLIDGGDVLAQVAVDVAPRDTALELNLRCYEAAVGAFEELTSRLALGSVKGTPQDLSARTYFALHQRPDAAAILDWRQPAEKLDALVRALDFGPYPNALGLAKLSLGDGFVHVAAAEPWSAEKAGASPEQGSANGAARPGTLLALNPERWVVATGSGALAITQLRSLDGEPVDLVAVAQRHGLREGATLPVLDDPARETIGRVNASLAVHESYWVNRLAELRPVLLPRLASGRPAGKVTETVRFDTAARPEHPAAAERQPATEHPAAAERQPATEHPAAAERQPATEHPAAAERQPATEHPAATEPGPTAGPDVVLAAFAVYLSRLTAADGFDLGLWDAERAQRLEVPPGLIADWVPFPLAVDLDAPFAELVRDVGRKLDESRRRGSYLQEGTARHPRIRGVKPSYPVAVAIGATGLSSPQSPWPSSPPGGVLLLDVDGDGREVRWRYDPHAFTADTIERMVAEFTVLLDNVVAARDLGTGDRAAPDPAAGDLGLVPPADLRLIVDELNRTEAEYPRDACVHHLIEAQVDRTPDRIAARFDGARLTYAELEARANQVAHYLASLGIPAGGLVGVYIDRSLEMLVAILGVLKTGAGYVPLDPLYPPDRVAFMLEDSGCTVVLSQTALLPHLPEDKVRVVLVDAEPGPFAPFPTTRPVVPVLPTETAYVIYTSGSTGRPKGVVVPHRGVVSFLVSMQEAPGLRPDDVLASVTTICFDISVLEMFLPLVSGACVAIVPRAVAEDGEALARHLEDSRATVFQATPATYRLLLEARWKGVPGLRVICGGEPLPRELANAILERAAELWNGYGPTETTVYSTVESITGREGIISIGRPIANTRVYIVDRRLQLVPFGCTGELLIGGDGVVRGYHARPDLTAERFVTVRFGGSEERVYRTGDLVRYFPDGRIECLGRIDHQVKIRGFRIELGEIESLLDAHSRVQGSAVIAREDRPGDRKLAAYVVPKGAGVERDRLIAELRERVQASLPAYMMPAAFVVLDEFPLTQNGKIDRKALPQPERGTSVPSESFDAPRGDLEQAIATVWQEALGVERVGRADDFFELGGHSVTLQRVRTLLQERAGHTISSLDVFRAPTVASLAARMTGASATGDSAPAHARNPQVVVGRRPFFSKLKVAAQRHLVPQFVVSLYYLTRYGAKISPWAEVELSSLLTFGPGCIVDSFTKIKATDGPVRFGGRCGIANGCFIAGTQRGVFIGDNFVCGPHVTIISNAYIFDQKGVHIWDQGHISSGVRIGNNVWLGAGVTVLDGSELGDDTIVVAGSVIDRKHPPGVILRGNPAEIVAYR